MNCKHSVPYSLRQFYANYNAPSREELLVLIRRVAKFPELAAEPNSGLRADILWAAGPRETWDV